MVNDYSRKVTHHGYENLEKLKKYYHRLDKIICVKKVDDTTSLFAYYFYDNNFVYYSTSGNISPIICIVIFSWLSIGLFWIVDEVLTTVYLFIAVLSGLITIFFAIYLFTKPKKERILNRRDGLVTMTGFFWQKNITMEFKKVEFSYSTGGEDGTGAFNLECIRPNKWKTFDDFSSAGLNCYQGISFITWYMDKNRPLPPGPVFDEFRDKDFERRKAAGFPKPLSPSIIPTPEATPEQQAERERIGGW